jgi:hypothetical protein
LANHQQYHPNNFPNYNQNLGNYNYHRNSNTNNQYQFNPQPLPSYNHMNNHQASQPITESIFPNFSESSKTSPMLSKGFNANSTAPNMSKSHSSNTVSPTMTKDTNMKTFAPHLDKTTNSTIFAPKKESAINNNTTGSTHVNLIFGGEDGLLSMLGIEKKCELEELSAFPYQDATSTLLNPSGKFDSSSDIGK